MRCIIGAFGILEVNDNGKKGVDFCVKGGCASVIRISNTRVYKRTLGWIKATTECR